MFVKKLVDRATKKPGENLECLKPEDVNPRLAFHYGLPSSAAMLAYDPGQKILAVSTKNGLIKLFGKDNTQTLLQSNDAQPSKFLQFIQNQGILLNVTSKDQIEVWDIDKKILCHVVDFNEVITSFSVMQHCFFILIGNLAGNVMVWKLNKESYQMEQMKYWIPFVASHGCINKGPVDRAVTYILPQPTAENKRILLIFADGSMILWGIRESKAVFTIGTSGNTNHLSSQEAKRVTSTCWICPFGTKVAVGYDSGDILIYTVSNSDAENGSPVSGDSCKNQIVNTSKINLGYRLEKTPIASLKWVCSGGKASRLYVIGASDDTSTNLVQVILLNEDAESRTIKVGLQLPEPCIDLEIISCPSETSKHYQQYLLLLGKSGLIYAYDDHSIEKCLLQSQSKSSVSLPSELMIKLPISASTTTTAQFITNHFNSTDATDEDYNSLLKNFPSVLPSEAKHVGLPQFTGFAKVKNLYITGHDDGTIKFWDVTCPLLIPLVSLTQQNDDESSQSGIAVTAIHYCTSSRLLFSGDKIGIVRIYQFKPEPFPVENGFFSLSGSSKKGSSHMIHSVKCVKVNGSVLSFDISSNSRHLAVGSEQGHISVIDVEGQAILYQKKIATELSADVIALKFESPNIQGFEKNVLLIMTKDSSLWALDADTGNTLSSSSVHPKKPSRSLFMQILEASRGSSTEEAAQKQQVLLCSEKAVYIYSLPHIIQGVKKVINKKKFNSSSCFWASTICSTSSSGLILLFSCGRIEIRSLPDLTVVKETTLRSFTCSPLKQNAFPEFVVCSSADGEVIMMRSNQEVAVASMLLDNGKYRLLDCLSRVYNENLTTMENATTTPSVHQKEKKKGMFGTLFKDVTGSKMNHGADPEAVDGRTISEELTKHFAVSNFPTQSQGFVNTTVQDENNDLDIDDIDLDDQEEKPKGNNVRTLLNTQKLASKFQSFKGRLKQIAVKNEKSSAQEEPQYEKAETVDQIKKKYGYSSSSPTCESSAAKMAESKLIENVKKLQGISLKTTEMQDSAQTFSSMAKETLRLAEQKNITK